MSRVLKDSGVYYIGAIPENRKTSLFKWGIIHLKTGLNPRDNFKLDKTSPNFYVTIKNFKNGELFLDDKCDNMDDEARAIIHERSDLKKGDILFASISKDGQAFLIKEDPINRDINESVFTIRVDESYLNNRFFYYYIINNSFFNNLLIGATGTTFLSIKQNDILNSFILLPPLSEQEKIADYLDKKCSKIDEQKENYEKSIELLKEYRESLIDTKINNSQFEKIKVKYAVKVRNEKSVVDENDDYVSLENIEAKSGKYIKTEGDYIGSDCKTFFKGDLLINKLRPYLTKSLLCEFDGKCTGEVEVVKEFLGDMKFLKYYSLSKTFIDDVNSSTYGTKMPRASRDYIENIKMPIPLFEEQKLIADYLDKECSKIDKVITYREQMIEKLDEYKKSLIYECVTGKKEIK